MKQKIYEDIECPRCKGDWNTNNFECLSCQQGIIPARTQKFIEANFFTVDENEYLCEYNHSISRTNVVMINLTVIKENYSYYSLKTGNTYTDFPYNTVQLIDTLMNHYTDGIYHKLDRKHKF